MTSTCSATTWPAMADDFDTPTEQIAEQAREDERRQIARDLSDDVGQQIAFLVIDLDLLRQQTAACHPDMMRQHLDEVLARVQAIGSSVRHVSQRLHASTAAVW
jgi:signal transduction histidine kinase